MNKYFDLNLLAMLALILFLLTGCGDDPKNSPATNTFSSIYKTIIAPNCKSCHIDGGSGAVYGVPLRFSSESSARSTLLANKGLVSTGCQEINYVVSGSPRTSLLAATLVASVYREGFANDPSCLPSKTHVTLNDVAGTLTNLTSAEQQLILDWINAGLP